MFQSLKLPTELQNFGTLFGFIKTDNTAYQAFSWPRDIAKLNIYLLVSSRRVDILFDEWGKKCLTPGLHVN